MVPPANEGLQPRNMPHLLHEDGIEKFSARGGH